jgi:hypothetical protein
MRATNNVPVLVERPFYFKRDFAGNGTPIEGVHVAAGSLPSQQLFFAEGNVLEGWNQFLTLFNPAGAAQDVVVQYLLEGAPSQTRTYAVPAGARKTIQVYTNAPDQGVGRDATPMASKGVSMVVRTSGPGIVAERPLYLRSSLTTGVTRRTPVTGGHDGVGASQAQMCVTFASAFGRFDARYNRSFVTLANGSPQRVGVTVDLIYGRARHPFDYTIDPESRLTVEVSTLSTADRYGVQVTTGTGTFVAELAVYAGLGPGLYVDPGVLAPTPCAAPPGQQS